MNLKRNKTIFLLIFLLININRISYGQNLVCDFLKQSQYYSYKNEYIHLVFETNKICFNKNDTIFAKISIKNTSTDSIYIIKDNFCKKKYDKDGIIFEYGGGFNGGSIHGVKMLKISPDSSFVSNSYVLTNELIKDNFKNLFPLILSLGYIHNFNYIKSNYIDTKTNEFLYFYYEDGFTIISSTVLDLYMSRFNSANLWINIIE